MIYWQRYWILLIPSFVILFPSPHCLHWWEPWIQRNFFKCLKLPQFTNLKNTPSAIFRQIDGKIDFLLESLFQYISFLNIFRFQRKNDLLWSRVKFQPIIHNEQLDIQFLNSLLQYLIHTLSMTYKWPLVLIQIATSQNCRDWKKFVKMHVYLKLF